MKLILPFYLAILDQILVHVGESDSLAVSVRSGPEENKAFAKKRNIKKKIGPPWRTNRRWCFPACMPSLIRDHRSHFDQEQLLLPFRISLCYSGRYRITATIKTVTEYIFGWVHTTVDPSKIWMIHILLRFGLCCSGYSTHDSYGDKMGLRAAYYTWN